MEGDIPVFEAEARGVLEALMWIQEMQKFDVDIELDSLLTVNAIHKGHEFNLEVGDVLNECRSMLLNR